MDAMATMPMQAAMEVEAIALVQGQEVMRVMEETRRLAMVGHPTLHLQRAAMGAKHTAKGPQLTPIR
jgi:uncharacterized protein YjiK